MYWGKGSSHSSSDVAERLADLELLAVVDVEVELGRLEDEDDRRAEPEPADLVSGSQRLTSEHGARFRVRRFAEGAGDDRSKRRIGS